MADEFAEDGVFGSEIEGGHTEELLRLGVRAPFGASGQVGCIEAGRVVRPPQVGLGAGDILYVVAASNVFPAAGFGDGVFIRNREGADAALHRSVDAELFG